MLCLFAIGAKLWLIIENGFGTGKELLYTILLLGSLSISSVILYQKIYKRR
jgi:hypothetical protein